MKKINKITQILSIIIIFLQFFILNFNFKNCCYAQNNEITTAKAMALIETSTGRILYSKDENKRLPMASTTKIITAIVAIEHCENLDKKHQIPKEAVGIEGSSIYLRENENLSIRELLYGLMLRSGNDSAVAIAIIISGSVENFVNLMNELCNKLMLKNTNIVTVNGLHDDNHYTTALDLAKISAYALKNKVFSEIVSTREKLISDENSKTGHRYLKNKNKLLKMISGADGVKTGYTLKAGRCFVGSATRNNMQVVCVVLNCGPMFEETASLIERAFHEYSIYKLLKAGSICETSILNNNKPQKIPVILKEDLCYPLTKDEILSIKANVILSDKLKAPLSDNDEIGNIEIKLKNNLIFSQKLYTINIVENKGESLIQKIIKAF